MSKQKQCILAVKLKPYIPLYKISEHTMLKSLRRPSCSSNKSTKSPVSL